MVDDGICEFAYRLVFLSPPLAGDNVHGCTSVTGGMDAESDWLGWGRSR